MRLVEAVDFIDEQQGPLPVLTADLGGFEHAAQIGHAGENCADLHKGKVGFGSEQPGNGGFAHAGRPPEDQRRQAARAQHRAERASGRQNVRLADDITQPLRAQLICQRARGCGGGRGSIEQVSHGGQTNPRGRK